MSKVAYTEEKNEFREGVPEDVLDELADELAEEEEEEEPTAVEIAEVAAEEAGAGADLVDTYLKSVGRFPMLKIEEEHEYVRRLEEGKAALKSIALSSPLAIPRVLALGANIKQGHVKAADVLMGNDAHCRSWIAMNGSAAEAQATRGRRGGREGRRRAAAG